MPHVASLVDWVEECGCNAAIGAGDKQKSEALREAGGESLADRKVMAVVVPERTDAGEVPGKGEEEGDGGRQEDKELRSGCKEGWPQAKAASHSQADHTEGRKVIDEDVKVPLRRVAVA